MMATYPELDAAVFSLLSNDGGLTALVSTRIRYLIAQETDAMPAVIFYNVTGQVPNRCPRDEVDEIFRIESRGTYAAQARSVHDAVYAAVHEKALTISGWTNYWLVCERQQRFNDDLDGKQYFRFIWDVRVKASSN